MKEEQMEQNRKKKERRTKMKRVDIEFLFIVVAVNAHLYSSCFFIGANQCQLQYESFLRKVRCAPYHCRAGVAASAISTLYTSQCSSFSFRLTPFQTDIGSRLTNMSGRTPSFIVVGLVIIMFLLGLFYMSCSSKNTELRLSLEQFEERIRSVTITSLRILLLNP